MLQTGCLCRLQLLLVLVSAVILMSEFRGTHGHILPSQIRDSSNLEGQVTVFISPRNRVVNLYTQALGYSIFVASYDFQGYGGGIRIYLHTGLNCTYLLLILFISLARIAQKTPCPFLFHGCLFPRKCVFCAAAWKLRPLLVPIFRLSVVVSQCYQSKERLFPQTASPR
jgi:hypothetical protein